MEDLPLLVLDNVCEYLTDIESDRASLRSFALTSRTCYAVAKRQLFSEIRLDKGPQPFRQRLARLEDVLDRSSARNFVRTLRVGWLVNYGSPVEAQFSEQAVWTPLARFISTLALKKTRLGCTLPGTFLHTLGAERQAPVMPLVCRLS